MDVAINYGVKTGFNEAFIIDEEKRDALIATDPNSIKIIKPVLRGRDIKRYHSSFSNLWLIIAKYGSHKYLKDKYPAVYNYLEGHELRLKKEGNAILVAKEIKVNITGLN